MIYGDICINSAKTCAVTGNRYIEKPFNGNLLKETFLNIIALGYDTILIGMSVGFDTECFHALEKIRIEKNIRIIACIPCENQAEKFTENQKTEYNRMISVADGKIYTGKEYTPKCMQIRNVFMVDNCSLLLAYMKKEKGGTVNTVNYAKRKKVRISYF